jgi:uncharacterized membrane protein
MMRGVLTAIFLCLPFVAQPAFAQSDASGQRDSELTGLYLLTDYPAITATPGSTSTIPLRLQNSGLAPERYQLAVKNVPEGWTATLLGGGQPVAAAMPATDASVDLKLRVEIPAEAAAGSKSISVEATGGDRNVTLPIAVTLAKELPAKLSVEPKLPSLRGSPKSKFEYQLTLKNDSGRDLTASFTAEAPANFATSFTESYGTQELSSIPIDAGQSKDIKLTVRPPSRVDAGKYPVKVVVAAEDAKADAALSMEIVGTPQIQVSGRDGVLSARANAGEESTMPIVVANTGSAAAEQIELAATAPTGWKVEFEPKTIDRIEPGESSEVQAQIMPSAKSLNGDYMTTIRATSRGEEGSAQFRVTVTTSTLWGITGAGIIAAALLIMVGAVTRFGRR